MNIFIKIKNSFYNPKYYSEIAEKPFSYFSKYYLTFALLFALVFTIVITAGFIPLMIMVYEKVPQVANYFPQELSLNIKNGKVTTNVKEPYFIKIPADLKNSIGKLNSGDTNPNGNSIKASMDNLENIVVIDTKNKFDIDTFKSDKTFILLNSDTIAYMNRDNQISINSLSLVKDFSLDRSKVSDFINKAKPYLNVIYPIVFIGAFILGFIFILVKMVYLFFGALLIWLVAKIKGLKIGYKKSYKLGLMLMTPAIIITSILGLISAKLAVPFLFSLLLIIIAALNLNKGDESVAPSLAE